jgi:hypothetical protein
MKGAFSEEKTPMEFPVPQLQPRSKMVKKLALGPLMEDAFVQHDKKCPGEAMIPIGLAPDIDLTESGEYPIWVQDGIVQLLISCPSEGHQNLSQVLFLQFSVN